MKKIIILVSFFITLNVAAKSNWVFAAREEESGNEYFVDKNSIQKSGDSVTFWSNRNNKVRDEQGILSWKVQQTINCRSREIIMRYYLTYDDLNNYGKVLTNFAAANARWNPIPPDSVNWFLYIFVCNK